MIVKMEFEKKEITKKSDDFSRWYTDVITKAELADYAPVRGCIVFRPYGFALWEGVQTHLGGMIKAAGVPNAYFPLFIPYSFLEKEKEHFEGFSPQLAVVTHGGGKKLDEPLVVRPTSETIMYSMYAKWIQSYRDLPLKINQWCNIVRWELRTTPFLRTLEFLWQEGHTAHATHEESEKETLDRLEMYRQFIEECLAIPLVLGRKSESEKFPGGLNTFTIEAVMPDGKALQMGTSHDLGQNFAKMFGIQFQDEKGELKYVWQTSWGMTTRILGALIMVHGDDQGLVLPPKIAPIQVMIVPINPEDEGQVKYSEDLSATLRDVAAVQIDSRTQYSPGFKYNEWELKGVPLRIEIGRKEVEEATVTLVRRDTGEKIKVKKDQVGEKVEQLLDEIQANLYQKAKKFLEENTHEAANYEEFKKIMETDRGFIKAYWCENPECEEKIKTETKATIRAVPFKQSNEEGECVYCKKTAKTQVFFAQAY